MQREVREIRTQHLEAYLSYTCSCIRLGLGSFQKKKSIHTSCTTYPELSGFTDRLASSDCELLWTECEGDWFQVHQHVVCPGGENIKAIFQKILWLICSPIMGHFCHSVACGRTWLTFRKARERDKRNKIKISHFFPEEQINFRRLGWDIFRH